MDEVVLTLYLGVFDRWDAPESWAVWVGILLLDIVAISRALVRGHGVESTLAWILAVIAFPGVGSLAYLFIANPSLRHWDKKRCAVPGGEGGGSAEGEGKGGVLELAAALTDLPPSDGNKIRLLLEDEHAFSKIEAAIGAAERQVWAEYYIVRNDETGRRFLEVLAAAAKRGVEVRLLFDAVGSLRLDAKRLQLIREAGGHAQAFLPMNPLRRRWAVHHRNHRKLVVIDGMLVFTGGMNVGDEYSGRARRRGATHFKDTHLSLQGPVARDAAHVFADDWFLATEEKLPLPDRQVAEAGSGGATVAVLPSGPYQEYNASALAYFTAITQARTRCYVTTPYFVPDEPTIRALVCAAKRGVDVRLLVPASPDVPLVRAVARSAIGPLVKAGIRVWEYLPSMLHAKCITIDSSLTVVGSANVDVRSFRLNFEFGVVIEDESVTRDLDQRFMAELTDSSELTPAVLAAAGPIERLWLGCARLLSPLL